MKILSLPLIVLLLGLLVGCSQISNVERANLTNPGVREDFITHHPGCSHNENIKNGEIVRGMDIYEVLASWGLPNVYITSKNNNKKEYWVYYIGVENSNSILVYTLKFNDNVLEDWDIDQKRFVEQGMSNVVSLRAERPISIVPAGKK
ncbi:MAG: hypothetical protein B6D63_02695 [Candidatus Latescibacteria bacterium 4484_7]|nr:MAG: hypothetical protein B6D63_02695 [Candidatus Latescibacteria bacterium 4484_7]